MHTHPIPRPPPFPGSRLEWRHWRWWYVLSAIAISVASNMLPTLLHLQQTLGQAVQALAQIALVIALAAALAGRIGAADLGLQWRGSVRTLGVGVLTAAAMGLASWLFARYSREGAEASRQVMASFGFGQDPVRDAGLVLIIAFLGPLTEEVLFRGWAFRTLRDGTVRWLPGWLASGMAMLVSSWLFMGIHGGEGQDAQLWMLLLMGVLFALAYEFGGSLYAPILAHSLNNAYALYEGFTGKAALPAPEWLLGLLMACPVLAVGVAWLIGRAIPEWAGRRAGSVAA